jgi:hypothetical protein
LIDKRVFRHFSSSSSSLIVFSDILWMTDMLF